MTNKINHFSIRSNLSVKLLLLTIFFVLLAEVFIYIPSVINFRKTWLEERMVAANIAILAIEAAPDHMISEMLTKKLLGNAKMVAISVKHKDTRQLLLNTDTPLAIAGRYDLRNLSYWEMLRDTFAILYHKQNHKSLIQVTGYISDTQPDNDSFIEIIFHEDLLCEDMHNFSVNVMLLSIIISLITAGLVYFSLSLLLIRPVQRITNNVIAFRESPEIAANKLSAEGRQDEIGIIMEELGIMQDEIRKALAQKKHLAALGESVSKINHDLRNILSSAQMVTDHLSNIDNPIVQKLAPRFVTAVDRAIRLCENSLKYGKAEVEEPETSPIKLHQILEDVSISLGILDLEALSFNNNIPEDFTLKADSDQLFRVFLNLCRNALQAMTQEGEIILSAYHEENHTVIDIIDNGPGIPARIKDHIFRPFHGSSNGGSGLGLAISKELVEAHGGHLGLIKSDETGTHFRVTLPL